MVAQLESRVRRAARRLRSSAVRKVADSGQSGVQNLQMMPRSTVAMPSRMKIQRLGEGQGGERRGMGEELTSRRSLRRRPSLRLRRRGADYM